MLVIIFIETICFIIFGAHSRKVSKLGMLNEVRKFELRIKHSNSDSFSDPSIFVCQQWSTERRCSSLITFAWSASQRQRTHTQSGRCCCDVRSRGCDGPFLLAVAGSHGWRTHDVGDRRWHDVDGHMWKVKPWDHATRCLVGIFVGLLWVVEGRSGPGGHGRWRSNCIFTQPSLHGYSHILLKSFDP